MKALTGFIFSLLFIHQIRAQNIHYKNTPVFTPTQLREDYSILVKTLREAYPSTYRYNSKSDLNQFFKTNISELNQSLTEKQFYPVIAATVAKMKDEHIISTPSEKYYDDVYKRSTKFLPFSIKVIGRRMYVCKSADPQLKTGTEIVLINGVGAQSIIQKLIKYIHRDGYISTFLYRHLEDFSPTQNENLFDLYFSVFYNLRNTVKLVVKSTNNKTFVINCPSLNYANYTKFYWQRNPHELPLSFKQFSDDIALIGISSFDGTYRDTYKQNFDTLFEQTFRRLDSNKTKNLILDLRRCEGGDNSYLLLLSYLMTKPFRVLDYIEVSYSGLPSTAKYFESTDNAFFADTLLQRTTTGMYRLKAKYESTIPGYTDIYPKRANFKGRVFVLTSGATGSAAAILASLLRNNNRATFIGEETGGSMEGPTSLNIPILVLPNSKIRVEIPLIRLQLAVKYIKGRGVIPDYAVQQSPEDLRCEKDTQLNFALKLAGGK